MKHLVINALHTKSTISKEIYGHFSEHLGRCIYEGLYVGEDNTEIPQVKGMRTDVVEALKNLHLPVLRWPGGCFADEYHWKDGIGEKSSRKKMINTHWGGVVEDNSFGTHEFLTLCEQIGCEPYINGNVGSGSVQEMSEWVEYLTFNGLSPMTTLREKNGRKDAWKVKYFGVGNESWGCGGNMRPEHYANEFRRYSTFARNYTDEHLYKIACGPNVDDYQWTEGLLKTLSPMDHYNGDLISGISLHYYTIPGDFEHKKSATDFDVETYHETIAKAYYMEELINRHSDIMNQYDPNKKLGLIVDEWGSWYQVEEGTNPGFLYQQNTMRDAMIAGISLNIFNAHSDRVHMANIAQLVNVLQSVILTDGKDMLCTPTYHVFDLYKEHMDATLVDSFIENETVGSGEYTFPMLSQSVSKAADGTLTCTMVNASEKDAAPIEILTVGKQVKNVCGQILTGEIHAKNTFDQPNAVHSEEFLDFEIKDSTIKVTLPPCSVVKLSLS